MTDRLPLTMWEPAQAHRVIADHAWPWIKSMLMAGHRIVGEFRQETRSDAQNRLLHGWIGQIARQLEWAGKKRDTDTWKRLLVAAWLRARGEHVEILPALDGHGVDVVFRHTSKLTRAECSELCEFVMAWAAQNGVEWVEPGSRRAVTVVDAETGEILEAAC
jgi:hypothetical protein